MLISQLISETRVVPDLIGKDKVAVLTVLADVLAQELPQVSGEEIVEIFMERERLGSTGIGKGVAVPHGRLKELEKPLAVLGRSINGVSYDANDGKPVHLLIALLSPDGSGMPHLQALSAISRLLNQDARRTQLLAASDQKNLYEAIILEENEG
ncbi:MAG: PTS sugar transporter subunit IIA [Magnetococcales bacterium]|nr:PTS sugar transporter subunit IIA [Magnetococcales bacterium]